jgi:clan AA aspartic protease
MIVGRVTPDDEPTLDLILGGRAWPALVDTGFNGFLELPNALQPVLNPRYLHDSVSVLAAGQSIIEQIFEVTIPFDGRPTVAEVSFAPVQQILVGTKLLANHELTINFKARTVRIERVP